MRMWMFVVLLVVGGCEASRRACPVGTTLVGARSASGRAEYCRSDERAVAALPTPGLTYASTLGFATPATLPGGASGPFTSWHPNGALASRGTYADLGGSSVPTGTWAFFDDRGRPEVLGVFHAGAPVGCFAIWEPDGTKWTGLVEGTTVRKAPCAPPPDEVLVTMLRDDDVTSGRARVDLTIAAALTDGLIGARGDRQVRRDARLRSTFDVSARVRLGRWRLGPSLGAKLSDDAGYYGFEAGLGAAVALPSPHARLDLEAGLDVGARWVRAVAYRPDVIGLGEVSFWSPTTSLHVRGALRMTDTLDFVIAAGAMATLPREVDASIVYCESGICTRAPPERWDLRSFAASVGGGLRFRFD